MYNTMQNHNETNISDNMLHTHQLARARARIFDWSACVCVSVKFDFSDYKIYFQVN